MKKTPIVVGIIILLVVLSAYLFSDVPQTKPLAQTLEPIHCVEGTVELFKGSFNDSTIIQCENVSYTAERVPLYTIAAYKNGKEIWSWGENNRTTDRIEIIDIENDGTQELLLASGDHGGTCTGSWQKYQIFDSGFKVIAEGNLGSEMIAYCDDFRHEATVEREGSSAAKAFLQARFVKVMDTITASEHYPCRYLTKEYSLVVYCEVNRNHGMDYVEAFKINTAPHQKIGSSIPDEKIISLFNCGGKGEGQVSMFKNEKRLYVCPESEHGSLWIEKIVRGDINGDGYEDAVILSGSCGASCGISFTIALQKSDGSVEEINPNLEKITTSGAARTGIDDIEIKNGIISITGGGFEDSAWVTNVGWAKETKQFILVGNVLSEVDSRR